MSWKYFSCVIASLADRDIKSAKVSYEIDFLMRTWSVHNSPLNKTWTNFVMLNLDLMMIASIVTMTIISFELISPERLLSQNFHVNICSSFNFSSNFTSHHRKVFNEFNDSGAIYLECPQIAQTNKKLILNNRLFRWAITRKATNNNQLMPRRDKLKSKSPCESKWNWMGKK